MLIRKDMPMPKNNFIIPKLGYYSFPSTASDFSFLNKIKSLKKHDEQNNKLSIIEEYYEEIKKDMKKKNYLFKDKNKYNKKHIQLIKNGGNSFYK